MYANFRYMKKHIIKSFTLSLVVAMTSASLYAQTDTANQQEESLGQEVGYGAGSVLANVFYIPAKLTYAGLGLVTGGLGYILSGGRPGVANNIIYPAIRGHYVVTPNHLKGNEPIYFVGAPPADSGTRVDAAPAASSTIR
jgi:hypothetical protein